MKTSYNIYKNNSYRNSFVYYFIFLEK